MIIHAGDEWWQSCMQITGHIIWYGMMKRVVIWWTRTEYYLETICGGDVRCCNIHPHDPSWLQMKNMKPAHRQLTNSITNKNINTRKTDYFFSRGKSSSESPETCCLSRLWSKGNLLRCCPTHLSSLGSFHHMVSPNLPFWNISWKEERKLIHCICFAVSLSEVSGSKAISL